jgi:Kef-type K+ transport system membrane component KefB
LQIEPIRNFFAALFLASIGMLIHVHFLWNHVDILLAAVILVIIIKTVIIAIVVKGFGYNNKTSLLVSILYHLPLTTHASLEQGIDLCNRVNVAKIDLGISF